MNEPNDVTHTDDNGVKYSYLGCNSYAVWMDKESRPYWREMPCNDIESAGYIQSVADIKRIAELEELIEITGSQYNLSRVAFMKQEVARSKRIAELEKENKELEDCFDDCYEDLGKVQHELEKALREQDDD